MSRYTIFPSDFINLISEYFKCNYEKAMEIIQNAHDYGKLNDLIVMVRFKR